MPSLGREEIIDGTLAQYRDLVALVRELDEDQWRTPTRCDGWTVAHVAGHVVGQVAEVTRLRYDLLAQPDSPDRQAEANVRREAGDVADQLDGLVDTLEAMSAAFDDEAWSTPIDRSFGDSTIGDGVHDLWHDTWVHTDDIRQALGREPEGPLRPNVLHVVKVLSRMGWGPATLALDGMERIDIGGGGDEVTGDPYVFVMIATGRAEPSLLGLDASVNVYA